LRGEWSQNSRGDAAANFVLGADRFSLIDPESVVKVTGTRRARCRPHRFDLGLRSSNCRRATIRPQGLALATTALTAAPEPTAGLFTAFGAGRGAAELA
jgi:hypothetical protein